MDNFDLEVYYAIHNLGIPAHLKGYEFLKTAMKYIHQNPNAIHAMTKDLYPSVAEMHGEDVEGSHVERGIRHAIGMSMADGATWLMVVGRVRPITNSEFLATLGESIKIKLATEDIV